ncbi:hypothetical protein ABPG74_019856 [Tetrahymena malaccensis]
MNIFIYAFLTLLVLQCTNCQTSEDIEMMIYCVQELEADNRCQENDQYCELENIKAKECIKDCTRSNFLDGIANCIKSKCSSKNQDVQIFLDDSVQCMSSNLIFFSTLILVITFLLILF